jgi:hypothetical protein
MKQVLLALIVLACSSDAVTLPDSLICGWVRKSEYRLASLPAGRCWRLTPGKGMAVTASNASPCDATAGAQPTIWPPGQLLALWIRLGDPSDPAADQAAIDCQ